jgi:uncharacterized membrane protein
MKRTKLILFSVFLFLAFAAPAANNCLSGAGNSTSLCDPTANFTKGDITQFGYHILTLFGILIGGWTIAYVMFAGFRMVISQGNEQELAKARSAFQWTLSGFVLALLAYVIVYGISDFIGAKDANPNPGGRGLGDVNPITSPDFAGLFIGMMKNFLLVAGILSLLLIIIAGFRYVSARGNEEQVTQARSGLLWSVIGLAVIILAYVIVVATAQLFGGTVTANP